MESQGYVVGDGEPLAVALHRLTTEQFTVAIMDVLAVITAIDAGGVTTEHHLATDHVDGVVGHRHDGVVVVTDLEVVNREAAQLIETVGQLVG